MAPLGGGGRGGLSRIFVKENGLNFSSDIYEHIEARRKAVRDRQFQSLGRLEKVQILADSIAVLDGNPLVNAKRSSASVDWYHTGPQVALSNDGRELLICSPIMKPPRIPDPQWTPSVIYEENLNPPMIDQLLLWVMSGVTDAQLSTALRSQFTVIQGIHQVSVIGDGGFILVDLKPDTQGRHTCMLINEQTGEGHFLYGVPDVSKSGRPPENPFAANQIVKPGEKSPWAGAGLK